MAVLPRFLRREGVIKHRFYRVGLKRRAGARAYLRQLAFRDFYAAVLHHWPESAWWNWNRDFDAIQTDTGADAKRRFEAWKAGETGFPIVDAGMRQLLETGFMHNRVRMIVASFLVKDLHLPWQWGAEWFLDQLVESIGIARMAKLLSDESDRSSRLRQVPRQRSCQLHGFFVPVRGDGSRLWVVEDHTDPPLFVATSRRTGPGSAPIPTRS